MSCGNSSQDISLNNLNCEVKDVNILGRLKGHEKLIKKITQNNKSRLLNDVLIQGRIKSSLIQIHDYPLWYLGKRNPAYVQRETILIEGQNSSLDLMTLNTSKINLNEIHFLRCCNGWNIQLAGNLDSGRFGMRDVYYMKVYK